MAHILWNGRGFIGPNVVTVIERPRISVDVGGDPWDASPSVYGRREGKKVVVCSYEWVLVSDRIGAGDVPCAPGISGAVCVEEGVVECGCAARGDVHPVGVAVDEIVRQDQGDVRNIEVYSGPAVFATPTVGDKGIVGQGTGDTLTYIGIKRKPSTKIGGTTAGAGSTWL